MRAIAIALALWPVNEPTPVELQMMISFLAPHDKEKGFANMFDIKPRIGYESHYLNRARSAAVSDSIIFL